MNALLSSSQNLNLMPRIVAETMLLQQFTKEPEAFLVDENGKFEDEKYFLASAQVKEVAGFGRGPTKRLAYVKAIAEFYERRLMYEAFSNELSYIPKVLQTSNGFAVHFTEAEAVQAASYEAIERHLLQYSFLKDGWKGFEYLNKKIIGDESLTYLASKYSINNLRAGMVLTTSKRFPGISFGYFVDREERIECSPRWPHATHEALDKIEPFLQIVKSQGLDIKPIEQGILDWMTKPYDALIFSNEEPVQALPSLTLETKIFNLSERWGLDFPLFGAYCFSPDLLPLIVVDRLDKNDSMLILELLKKFDLPLVIPERNPVL